MFALYRSPKGTTNVNPEAGAITERRHDPDARTYQKNNKMMARGIPWVDLECRQPDARNERLILDFDAVALNSDEVTVGMALVERTLNLLPEKQVLVWDGAMKGVHMRRLIADLGIIPLNHAAVPRPLRGATTSIRLDTTEQADKQRKWGLNENIRIIDYLDDDFSGIYGLRNSAESQNRRLEDTLWAGRAHSVGIPSGRIDHLGFALSINLIARIAYEQRTGTAPVPWLDRPSALAIAV